MVICPMNYVDGSWSVTNEANDNNNASNRFMDPTEDEEDEMDENYVYSALFKLTFHFEIDELAPKKLTNVVVKSRGDNHDNRCNAVRSWAKCYTGTRLSLNEANNLIKYVELYTLAPQHANGQPQGFVGTDPNPIDTAKGAEVRQDECGGNDDNQDFSHLTCPYRCEMAAWSAEINRQKLSKSVALYSDTAPSKEFSWSYRNLGNAQSSLTYC